MTTPTWRAVTSTDGTTCTHDHTSVVTAFECARRHGCDEIVRADEQQASNRWHGLDSYDVPCSHLHPSVKSAFTCSGERGREVGERKAVSA